ncbi:YopX family protein [Brevibacillus sp. DP1.3A]|uniref:YopX family protein n=1 Tax=Brevibacillus sp. DP1.3A TaxID=2738867 RepID=UPI00156AF9F6|nr:YopX family protein [Brevibacillus sp. DP1.3A]UED76086.1 YopX family protein [Brevibacillus sp. DP1.3A]
MREIKFRVWDKQNKTMIYQKPLSLTKFMITIDGDFGWFDFERQIWSGVMPKAFIELQQFTGIHDKNGQEIYEGDIIEAGHDDGAVYLEVAYDQEHARYVFIDREEDEWLDSYEWDEFEIIVKGNIYENQELLPAI